MRENTNNNANKTFGGVFDCLYDAHFTILSADPFFYQLLGYTKEEFAQQFHNHLLDVIYEEEKQRIMQEVESQIHNNHVFMYENRWVCKNGEVKWVWISAQLMHEDTSSYFHCLFHDITNSKQSLESLQVSEKRFQAILSETQDIVFEFDIKKHEVYYSENFEKKFGYKIPLENFPLTMLASDIIYHEDKQILKSAFQSLREGSDSLKCEYRLKYRNEGYRWVEASATAVRDEHEEVSTIIGIIMDIHEKKKAILESKKEASLDPMTNVLNRRAFLYAFDNLVKEKEDMAVILVDVDDFKLINDEFGHLKGDYVLFDIANILTKVFPDQLIGRYGGDEFIVCAHDFTQEEVIKQIHEFQLRIEKQEQLKHKVKINCSIGISFYPQHGNDFYTLFNKADVAMYRAKGEGKNKYCIFQEDVVMPIKPQRVMKKSFHDEVLEYAIHLFMKYPDHLQAIYALLQHVGNVFSYDRISIYENKEKSYDWNAHKQYRIQDDNIEQLEEICNFDDEKILFYENVDDIDDLVLKAWMQKRQVHSCVYISLMERGLNKLLLCFEDCQGKRKNIEEEHYTLQIVSEVIALLLLRERSADALQKYRLEQIQFLMDYTPGGVLGTYFEPGFPFCFANFKMLQLLGYENEAGFMEASQGSLINLIYEADRSDIEQTIRSQIYANGEYEVEYRLLHKEGNLIWINDKGKRFQTENHKDAIISILMDVTKEKEYQNQLQVYRESSNGGAFINRVDEDFTLLYANDLFYRIYEIDQEEFIKQGCKCIQLIHPEDQAYVERGIRDAYNQCSDKVSLQFRSLTKHGKVKWISLHGSFEIYENQMVMNGFIVDVTQEHVLKQEIAHKELIYRTALQTSHINVWEYHVKEQTLYLTDSILENHDIDKVIRNVPASLFEQKRIHPISITTTIDLYKKLNEGVADMQSDVLIKDRKEEYSWQRIHYHMIYDKEHKPFIAVAISEDITDRRKEKLRMNQEQMDQMLQKNKSSYPVCFRCNVSKNKVDILYSENKDTKSLHTYEDVLLFQENYVASPDDSVRFQNILNTEQLVKKYLQGQNMISCVYRRKDAFGDISWVEALGYLSLDANGQDISILGFMQNIEEIKRLEAQAPRNIEVNELGIYKKNSFQDMVQTALTHIQQNPCAFLLFQLTTNYENERQRELGNEELITLLKLCFPSTFIAGQLDSTTFAIFLYQHVSEQQIQHNLADMASLLNTSLFQSSIDCGAIIDVSTSSFHTLYTQALRILEEHKQCDTSGHRIHLENLLDKKIHPFQDYESVAVDWNLPDFITRMQSASSMQAAIEIALQEILVYYHAKQVCLWDIDQQYLYLEEEPSEVTKTLNDRAVSLSFAHIQAYLKNRTAPVYVRDPAVLEEFIMDDSQIQPYIFSSIEDKHQSIGILAVYAPKQNTMRLNFIYIINSILTSVLIKEKILQELDSIKHIDSVTKLMNGNRLREYMMMVDENSLHTLGVVYLDINGLKDINHIYGDHYGDEILVNVARVLKQYFAHAHIFRYAGDEFMIIIENTSFDVFMEKCKSLRMAMTEICDIAMGSAWAQKQISIHRLIHNAEEQLSLEKQKYYNEKGSSHHHKYKEATKQLLVAMKDGHIKMYLQQKVDSIHLHVVGAEALVRYEDEQHGLVPPVKFIPFLEATGLIYYVDIYIYEEVHRLLASWKKQGITLIPISLNFSRITLLENQLVERMNEINQRYGIDRNLIEIEITESIGEIERQTIIRICAQIEQAGYRLALDDFGSKYSNIAFLSDIRFHTLKFDKGLVDYLIGNESSRWILESIIMLCRRLNIYNVAEGVEQKEQVDILSELGCTYIQGYYYSKPVPYEIFDTSRNHRDD